MNKSKYRIVQYKHNERDMFEIEVWVEPFSMLFGLIKGGGYWSGIEEDVMTIDGLRPLKLEFDSLEEARRYIKFQGRFEKIIHNCN